MHVIWSNAALSPPPGKPRTDDMRAYVEYCETHGMIQMRPGAFQIGPNRMVVHPALRPTFEAACRLTSRRASLYSFTQGLFNT